MARFDIPVTEDRVYSLTTNHVLVMPGGKRFFLGCVARGTSARQVNQGPLVPGPWVYAGGLATVICANRNMGTGAVSERNRADGIEHDIHEGDTVVFDDVEYTIRFTDGFGGTRGRLEFLQLDLVRDLKGGNPNE